MCKTEFSVRVGNQPSGQRVYIAVITRQAERTDPCEPQIMENRAVSGVAVGKANEYQMLVLWLHISALYSSNKVWKTAFT